MTLFLPPLNALRGGSCTVLQTRLLYCLSVLREHIELLLFDREDRAHQKLGGRAVDARVNSLLIVGQRRRPECLHLLVLGLDLLSNLRRHYGLRRTWGALLEKDVDNLGLPSLGVFGWECYLFLSDFLCLAFSTHLY